MIEVLTGEIREAARSLHAGDALLLSGTVYTARDAAHKRITEAIAAKKNLPFRLLDAVIYYAGMTPARPGAASGSCGPTTSSRMDGFTPELISMGVAATIGKGDRSEAVYKAIKDYGALYLCAVGGAGAVAAEHIKESEIIAFEELGCEAVRRLRFDKFPLIVGIDALGNSAFYK